jgi:hypothetical protein
MYDLVLYLPSGEFGIEDDGVRTTDVKFQLAIDERVREILEKYKACDPLDGYDRVYQFVEHELKQSIEVCKLCAFDKQKDTQLPNIKFTLDPNFKKKFRNIPIKAI